jgi:hypothetical protein
MTKEKTIKTSEEQAIEAFRQSVLEAIEKLEVDVNPYCSNENEVSWNDAIYACLMAIEDLSPMTSK